MRFLPSRLRLAAMAIALVVGFIAVNKLCTGRFMPAIWGFNRYITPSFAPVGHFVRGEEPTAPP